MLCFLLLFLCAASCLPAASFAGHVVVFKERTLAGDTPYGLDGLLVMPFRIQVASWGLSGSGNDLLVYEPSSKTLSSYGASMLPNLPEPGAIITLADGTRDSLDHILDQRPYVIIDTDIGTVSSDVFGYLAATVPIPSNTGGDTTPPGTSITGGPSGTVGDADVAFTYTGSDNVTAAGDLVYACRLDGRDTDWSAYTASAAKSYTDLPDGAYTFLVRAQDAAGNFDATPAARSFTVSIADADGDGIPDDVENGACTEVDDADTDDDGLMDGEEDIDHDGVLDEGEADPCDADTDDDGLSDYEEAITHGTDPLSTDTDGDGLSDNAEIENGLDPLIATGPGIPVLIAPAAGATGTALSASLEVGYAANASSATHRTTRWQIGLDETFSSLVMDVTTDSQLLTLTVTDLVLDSDTLYHWRVCFTGDDGLQRSWSDTGRFTTTVDDRGDGDGDQVPDDQEPAAITIVPDAEAGWQDDLYRLTGQDGNGDTFEAGLRLADDGSSLLFFEHLPDIPDNCPTSIDLGLLAMKIQVPTPRGGHLC